MLQDIRTALGILRPIGDDRVTPAIEVLERVEKRLTRKAMAIAARPAPSSLNTPHGFEKLDVVRLAHAFHSAYRLAILGDPEFASDPSDSKAECAGPYVLEQIDRENALWADGSCATHDYRDANMVMAEAFEAAMGRPAAVEESADADLWNAAWNAARVHGFAKAWPE